MAQEFLNAVTRRKAVLGGALAAAGLAIGSGVASAGPAVQSGGGIAGGGTIKVGENLATFSLFASRFVDADKTEPVFLGRIQWADESGLVFESSEITKYGPTDDDQSARIIEGKAKLSTGEEVPFSFLVRDSKSPGAGNDDLKLTVTLADGSTYGVDGSLESGDLQLLTFTFPE